MRNWMKQVEIARGLQNLGCTRKKFWKASIQTETQITMFTGYFWSPEVWLHLKNFNKLIQETKHYVPEKKSKPVRKKTWIDNSTKKQAAKKQNFYQISVQQKTNVKKIDTIEWEIGYREDCSKKWKRRIYQKVLVMNAKRTTKTLRNKL